MEDRRDKARAPQSLPAARLHAAADEHNEARQVFILRAEAVRDPRSHRRPALPRRAGEEHQLRWRVVELIGEHGFHHTHFVRNAVEIWDRIGHPDAALAVLRECVRRAHELRHAGGECEFFALDESVRRILAVVLHQLGLVVENVEMRRPTGHVEIHDTLHLRREVRFVRRKRIHGGGEAGCARAEKRIHRHRAERKLPGVAEEMAARLRLEEIEVRVHAEKNAVSVSSRFHRDSAACSRPSSTRRGLQHQRPLARGRSDSSPSRAPSFHLADTMAAPRRARR